MKKIKIKIDKQGSSILSNKFAYVEKESEDILCLIIDMKSKYCEISCTGSGISIPFLHIEATGRSLYLHKKYLTEEDTQISFPQLKNWNIYATSAGRYTINVVLIKEHLK